MLAVVFESDLAADLGEQRVVLAEPDVQTRFEAPALLAHQDGTAGDDVTVMPLDAQPLGIAVAAVAGTALPFFMSHCLDLDLNIGDADAREDAAMTARLPEALAPLFLEYPELGPT